MSQITPGQEFLQTLVDCERYRTMFHDGIPARACLRRQVERQRGAKAGALGPPTKPFCAGQCARGIEIATLAASVGVTALACTSCGQACFGDVPCDCRTEAAEKTKPPKGLLSPLGSPAQDRIWKGGVPDVPIGPPPGAPTKGEQAAAAIVARVREAAPRVAPAAPSNEDKKEEVAPQAAERTRIIPGNIPGPAKPAEPEERESEMADKRCEDCGKALRADNTSGHCGDRSACRARCAGTKPAAPPKLPPKPKGVRTAPARKVRAPSAGLENMTSAELRAMRSDIDELLLSRVEEMEAESKAIRAVLGEAA